MSTIRNPVGPQSKGVYWRRRILVLLGLIAIIVVIVLIVTGRGSATPEKNTGKTTSTAPVDASTAPPAAGAACDPKDIELLAITDAASYDAGVQPMLSLTITNIGTEPCSINAGTSQQEFIITSGSETIWNSKDCQQNPVDAEITLQPNTPNSTTPIAWDRTRSSVGTCAATDRPQVTGGGASYHLSVKVGDIESPETKQFLLY
jgi:hypothetical protein